MLLFAAMLAKTGLWLIPNIGDGLRIAQDPFAQTIQEPSAQYIMSSWLAPFIAWLLGARTEAPFLLVYLGYVLGFLALVVTLAFAELEEREARIALVVFAALPVSASGLFWISHDGLTFLLIVTALALRRRPALAALVGMALGMQHFEQAFIGFAALGLASVSTPSFGGQAPVSGRFSLAVLAGIVTGKLALLGIFHLVGLAPQGRLTWLLDRLPMLAGQFWFHAHQVVWAGLGVGWLVALRYADRGRAAIPFFAALGGLMIVLVISEDQTRVFAAVTLPLLYAFWLSEPSFLRQLARREGAALLVVWLLVPWAWTWGGVPTWSALPYDLALLGNRLFGWPNVPPTSALGEWPFAAGR
ncbi:MAG: hypothetical protein ACK4JB_26240 [Reyranella sp.]